MCCPKGKPSRPASEQVLPPTAYSNCPLAVLWLWLSGRAQWVVATRSDIGWWWPWHLGTVSRRNPELVYHFKRTRLIKRQTFAPFYFEGRMLAVSRSALLRSKAFLWERPALQVVPLLALLVAVGLPVWMVVSASYWPYWLVAGALQSLSRRRWK